MTLVLCFSLGFGRNHHRKRPQTAARELPRFFSTQLQRFSAVFFQLRTCFQKSQVFKQTQKDGFFFAFLRPCGQKWRFMWRMGDVFRGWPRTIVDHPVIIVICYKCYKTSTNVIFPKTSWPFCFRGSPRESSRGCQRSSRYSPRCKQLTCMMTKQLRIQLTLQLEAQLRIQLRIQLTLQLEARVRIQLTLLLEAKLTIQLMLQLEAQLRI